jgi:hypothetical protein
MRSLRNPRNGSAVRPMSSPSVTVTLIDTDSKEEEMDDVPILICYDGSEGARRAIAVAAALMGSRQAVVLDIGPPLTRSRAWRRSTPSFLGRPSRI